MYLSDCSAALRWSSVLKLVGIGHLVDDRHDLAGVGAPGDLRSDVGGVVDFHAVVLRAGVGGELPPALDGGVEIFSLGGEFAPFDVFEGGFVGGDHARPAPASIDMLQTVIRCSIEKLRMTGPVYSIT